MLKLPAYASIGQRIGWYAFLGFCALVFLFLVAPLIAIVPLSFNQSTFLTYPMPGVSLRWYEVFFNSAPWQLSIRNTFIVGICAAVLATTLGTLASLGMAQARFPMRSLVMALVVSPMVVPFVITALGMFFFFSQIGLTNSLT